MKTRLRELYYGSSDRAHRFRYALLAFDITTIGFVIVTSFFPYTRVVGMIDVVIGAVILMDFAAYFWATNRRMRHFLKLSTWADLVAMISFLAPIAGEGFGFLRILRTLRLFHTYQLISRLRKDFQVFRENELVVQASVNLMVFLFVMTGVVFATQQSQNPQIGNYADALYFTVTTLTTTGFGDITLEGTAGRMLSVVVMIVGITLFLRLAAALFRPHKVQHECETCGLKLHDADAVHCKHCGATVRIETEGRL